MDHILTGVHRDPDKTREDILNAAMNEIVENGFGGARIDRIAERSGFNKRMIYHYFGDKEQLYVAVLDHALGKMRIAETCLNFHKMAPEEGVEEIVRFVWHYFLENPEILSLLGTENLQRAKFIHRSPNGRLLNHHLVRELGKYLRQGSAHGAFIAEIDPLNVFLTVLSLSFFYLSNRYTLSTIFSRDFTEGTYLRLWEAHIVHVVQKSIAR
ncbi:MULTISPECIES: TetR/AcrR family transcriptional regulator [unclassified Rhizobium]|uniref:TetR/AcrR family transcriptional regulator n=1 Tax=unclassified Rhizobium TaxID=2613769 RepID=UPI00161E602A|nr:MULTISPECIES: TetR/AcrR family transcriptional regulator [unclassified Rhizobium]MBB3544946.1 AcrR family transcriptional regulator [Rhizobium sp. BK399]MCS3744245.1 AcrR family transcriptional regulator [Rhizobium sp. BK661]